MIPLRDRLKLYERLNGKAKMMPESYWRTGFFKPQNKEKSKENPALYGKNINFGQIYPAFICEVCFKEINFINQPFCKKCGRKLEDGSSEGDGLCTECQKRERAFTEVRCIMTYDEVAKGILYDLKYKGKREFAFLLSMLAADKLGTWIRVIHPDAIIPVPIHKKRMRERGYNQAELIARGIGQILDIPVFTDVLFRKKNTRAQKTLNANERLSNLQNAFGVDIRKSRLGRVNKKPTVLLIDDIFTTGMTLNICTEKLLEKGAAKVYGLCVASGKDITKKAYKR